MPVAYGLIEPEDLSLPHIPAAAHGLRIAHLSDLHVTRYSRRIDRLGTQLTALRLDLVFLTGDYMNEPGDEPAAIDAMKRLCDRLQPAIGTFGVYGNHDSPALRDALSDLPVHWLHNEAFQIPAYQIELMGLGALRHEMPDPVAMALARDARRRTPPPTATPPSALPPSRQPLRLLLAHHPSVFPTAADLKVDVQFSGHTHGGQIRMPIKGALVNACDLPLSMSSGLLRHRDTLVCISRGLGEVGFPRQRLFCRPHAPVYTIRRGSMPGRYTEHLELLRAW